ncbi:pilin [Hyalangium minutum]|uniref:pilin n=1 Tax=Hyalangium minutum TaxID=394096 RepID=UPI003B8346E4
MLAAIAIPNFIRFQARARQSEVHGNLKALFTGLRTQQRRPPAVIRATGFAPERGNRYSYHLENGCSSMEDRSNQMPIQNNNDTCIGVDVFRFGPSFPPFFVAQALPSANWGPEAPAAMSGKTDAGIYGDDATWGFLAYGAGDVDNAPASDKADTWVIGSYDAVMASSCPASANINVAAGEPFNVYNDVNCD